MIICEYSFNQPDSKNPNYSFDEVDYYSWILSDSDFPNHRLSLRKNLITGEFEVYRRFQQKQIFSINGFTIDTNVETGYEEVAFKSKDLGEAIKFADSEWTRFHGEEKEPDKVCEHKYPVKATFCRGDL